MYRGVSAGRAARLAPLSFGSNDGSAQSFYPNGPGATFEAPIPTPMPDYLPWLVRWPFLLLQLACCGLWQGLAPLRDAAAQPTGFAAGEYAPAWEYFLLPVLSKRRRSL